MRRAVGGCQALGRVGGEGVGRAERGKEAVVGGGVARLHPSS